VRGNPLDKQADCLATHADVVSYKCMRLTLTTTITAMHKQATHIINTSFAGRYRLIGTEKGCKKANNTERRGIFNFRVIGAFALFFALSFATLVNAVPLTLSAAVPIQRIAQLGDATISADGRQVADWVASSLDNGELDFFIIDKRNALVHIFNADALLLGSSPVLLGAARGDDSVPGIGVRPMNKIAAFERTTPAGRFIAERGKNTDGEEIVWIDYDAAVSMHRVRPFVKAERRLERLATQTPADNRISYGCVNVPIRFYETFIQPLFRKSRAVVYVLPEIKSIEEVFGLAVAGRDLSSPTSLPLDPAPSQP